MFGDHPPRPRLTLNLGVTGHRATRLPAGVLPQLAPVLDQCFVALREATLRLHREESAIFAPEPAQLRLNTPLATGADQLAGVAARRAGYSVHALLPFAPEVYADDFAVGEERAEFERQLAAADAVFALPGDRSDGENAYVLVGKAVIAASDILLAVWDGAAEIGPGGTAHVVDLALRAGVPVIHVPVDRAAGKVGRVALLSGGDAFEPIASALDGPDAYDALLRKALAPIGPRAGGQR